MQITRYTFRRPQYQSVHTLQFDHRVTCTTESTSGWARAGVALARFARGNFESFRVVSLAIPFLSSFSFPRELSVVLFGTGHKGAESHWRDILGQQSWAPSSCCCPLPRAGGRLYACVSLFHLIPTLCGGIPVAGHERGCNRVGYVKPSAQASAVHDACQGLWSTDTCAPGYSTKYRSHIELCVSVCCSSE